MHMHCRYIRTFNTNDWRSTNSVCAIGTKCRCKSVVGVVCVCTLCCTGGSYLEEKPCIWSRSEAQNMTRWERSGLIHWHWCGHWSVISNCKSCCEVGCNAEPISSWWSPHLQYVDAANNFQLTWLYTSYSTATNSRKMKCWNFSTDIEFKWWNDDLLCLWNVIGGVHHWTKNWHALSWRW